MARTAKRETGVDYDIERVQEMIPHRYPILMIDRVIDVVTNVNMQVKDTLYEMWLRIRRP